jgi:signal peptide peptidase SppA
MINIAKILGGIFGAQLNRPEASFLVPDFLERFSVAQPEASRLVGEPVMTPDRQVQYRKSNGVAVVTIDGAMAPRGVITDDRYRWQTYEGIQSRLDAVAADDSVHTLLADLNTPGGYVAKSFETADKFRRLAQIKRVVAIANPMMASAGYLLGAACPEIVAAPDSTMGSMGVLMAHQDWSKFMEMIGVKTTFIYRGKHKVDGNSSQPLTEGVLSDFQAEIDDIYAQYVARIGAFRPSLGTAGAMATEARTYFGARAVDAGLADRVSDFDTLLAELSTSPPQRGATFKGATMKTFTQAEFDVAVAAARAEGIEAGKAEGAKALSDALAKVAGAAKAETDRVNMILGSDQVKGKEKAALQIAHALPDATANKVIEIVAGLPNESASGTKSIAERTGGQGTLVALGTSADVPGKGASKIDTKAIYATRAVQQGAAHPK